MYPNFPFESDLTGNQNLSLFNHTSHTDCICRKDSLAKRKNNCLSAHTIQRKKTVNIWTYDLPALFQYIFHLLFFNTKCYINASSF